MSDVKFSKRTMARFNRQRKIRSRVVEEVRNLFDNIRRFHWSHADMLIVLKRIYSSDNWKRLPNYEHDYCSGIIDQLIHEVGRETESAYYIEGRNLPIRSEEYRKIKPQIVHERYSDKGCRVWSNNPDAVWYGHGMTTHVKFRNDEY